MNADVSQKTAGDATVNVQPPFVVSELSIEDGMALASWHTPGPWSVNDSLEPPEPDQGYWAVRDAEGQLVGYCCFDESARVPGLPADPSMLDVALGLRPDLVGHGLSNDLAQAVVDRAHQVAAGRQLRSVIDENNHLGRRAAERAGFKVAGSHDLAGGATLRHYLILTRS